MAFCSPSATAADLTASDVQRAIDGGVEFLRRQQLRNGSWGDYSAYTGGKTALCALAMLSCGVPKEDPQLALAIEYLRKIPPQYTYVVSLQTMVFCAADPERDKELIIRNVRWLERMQNHGSQRGGKRGIQCQSGRLGKSNQALAARSDCQRRMAILPC